MDVRNCKVCGKLFDYTGNALCPSCNKKFEEKFFEVRQYIYDNPTANMSAVAEDNDVPIQQIKRWVREERLSFSKDSGISISCEKCGRAILTGRFCGECKNTMKNSFTGLYVAPPAQKKKEGDSSAKMRFLQK